jgi:two-component system sensor histidine kinase ResE
MEGRFALPFHFAVEFLVLVVALGAAVDAVRARRAGAHRWAWGQAAGFAILAVAQFLHGGQFGEGSVGAAADAANIVLVLRTIAFGLLAVCAHPEAAISPFVSGAALPALFVPGPNAHLAMAPAALALVVAVRGVRAHRQDQDPATFAFAAAFVAFAAGEAMLAVSPPDGGGWLLASHASRAVGALLLARWLATAFVRSIRLRFVAVLVLVLTIGVLVVSAALNVVIGSNLEREELRLLRGAGQARQQSLVSLEQVDQSSAGAFAQAGGTQDRVRKAPGSSFDGSFLCAVVDLAAADADLIMFTDRRGLVFASIDVAAERRRRAAKNARACPATAPPSLTKSEQIAFSGSTVLTEARHGAEGASLDRFTFAPGTGPAAQIVVLAASPVYAQGQSQVSGAVLVGTRLGDRFVTKIRAEISSEASVVVAGADVTHPQPILIATTLSGQRAALEATLVANANNLIASQKSARYKAARLAVGHSTYLSMFVPLQREDRQAVGLLVLSRDQASLVAGQQRVTRTLFLITIAAVFLAALLAWLFAGRVTRPIRSLTSAARRLRGGDLEARARVATSDEVGSLGQAFNEMAETIGRSTRELSEANTTMAAVLQSMNDGLIATDAAGHIVTFNRAAELMTTKPAERALGKKVSEILVGSSSDNRPLSEVAMHASNADGFLGTGARALAVALSAAPLLDARGNTTGRVIVLRDMSPQIQAERMKSEFLSNVSHELRTPITPIKGYADIMRRKKVPREKAEQFLEGILQSTERLERIVEILVDFAAMEAGRLKPRSEPVVVRDLVEEAASKWKVKDARHRFVRRIGERLPPVLGDQRLLERSLDELIDNAVKFSADGRAIEIIAEPYTNGSRSRVTNKVAITVRDHGIGIEPDQMPDLFRDFVQLDGSETRTYGGLGLGLAYVKRIVTAHGGDVLVESAPGRGSAFSLVLPAAEEKEGTKRAPSASRKQQQRRKVSR